MQRAIIADVFFSRDPDEPRAFARRERIDAVLRWIRVCSGCRTLLPPIDLFCPDCLAKTMLSANRRVELRQAGYPFPTYSLFSWTDDEPGFQVKDMIHSFKGGRHWRAARFFTERFVHERMPIKLDREMILVHPPPTRPGQLDHSWLLTWSFARIWRGFAQVVALPSVTDRSGQTGQTGQPNQQKQLSVSDRARRRFGSLSGEKFSQLRERQPRWIFVDDVITSGATAMAAYMALGEPEYYEVWTLACRPKLAGKSSF